MIRNSIVLLAILTLALVPVASQERTTRRGPVVRQVDRILIESNDPEALFNLFTKLLNLPVAWPIAKNESYTSGSVSTGDVTLEIYRYGEPESSSSSARYTGLSFTPYPLDDALQELRIIGIPYDPPQVHTSILPNGKEGAAWKTVVLPSLSHPLMAVSLFEYSPQFLNVEVRRQQFGNRLTLNGGGPLGILSMHSIVLESTDAKKYESEWIRLLKKPDSNGYLQAVLGPAFRVTGGTDNRIHKIVLKVKSLTGAERFLMQENLMGIRDKGEVFIKPSAVQGLRISLIEKQ